MSLRELPARPNLEHLKNQARALQRAGVAAEPSAVIRFSAWGLVAADAKLADALYVVAREHGFETWPKLKLHMEAGSEDAWEALTAAIKSRDTASGDAALVREVLSRHPELKARIDEPLPNYSFDAPAILAAVHTENREAIDALLDFGANINGRSRWWAGSYGVLDTANPELAAYLIERGATVDIHAASRLGMIDRVRELLAADPRLVHVRGCDGQLPLHLAATVEIAALLLDYGAEIDAVGIDHESTAAQYMASSKHYMDSQSTYRHEVARFLIARGAKTDILMAAAVGDLGLVERIVAEDPKAVEITVSERDFPKRDPRSGGSIYIYGFGLAKSPHLVAAQFGHTAIFEFLMRRSAPWLRLTQAAELGDEARARQIAREHPSLCTQLDPVAARRIVGATLRGNTRAVELLLECGWPVDAALETNQTALHFACWHGNLALVEALIAHKAALRVFETEYGGSPFDWALHGSLNSWARDKGDCPRVVRALLTAGAEIPKQDWPLRATEEVLAVLRAFPQRLTPD